MIPARRGSSLAGKNLRKIHGRSLVDRAIDCAEGATRLLPDIVVTTDCPVVRDIARYRGCIAIERPWHLATDSVATIRAVWHALAVLSQSRPELAIDAVCLLQPTSPLRQSEDVDACIELMQRTCCGSVHTVAPAHTHPARQIWGDGSPVLAEQYYRNTRRQDLPIVYDRDGAVYLAKLRVIHSGTWYDKNTGRCWVLPKERHLDIEDAHDLRVAAALLSG